MAWSLVKHRDKFTLLLRIRIFSVVKNHDMKTYGGLKVKFHTLSTSAVDGEGWSVLRSGRTYSADLSFVSDGIALSLYFLGISSAP
jgi:hypothetical protein